MRYLICCLVGFNLACSGPSDVEKLNRIIEEEWDFRLIEDPLLATAMGDNSNNHLLPSMKFEDLERRNDTYVTFVEKLNGLDPGNLDAQSKINLELLKYQLENKISNFKFKTYLIPILADAGFHISFSRLPFDVPLETSDDYYDYIERLYAFHEYVQEHIALMRL